MKRSEALVNIAVVISDILMILVGFALAYYMRSDWSDFVPVKWMLPIGEYLQWIALFIPVWLGVFAALGLYVFAGPGNLFREIMRVIIAVSAVVSLMIIVIFFNREQFFSRLIIIYAWLFVSLAVILGRLLIRFGQRYLYKYGIGVRRVMIVGVAGKAKELVDYLHQNRGQGWELVGLIDDNKQKGEKIAEYRVLGDFAKLASIHKRYYLNEIWLVNDHQRTERTLELIQFCDDHDLVFRFVPSEVEVASSNIEVATVAGIPLITVKETSLEGWGRIIKRIFDLVFSLLVLIFFWWLLVVIAIAIKLDSSGPVFYRHTRVGRKGKLFTIYKFRSMKTEYSVGEGYGGKKAAEYYKKLEKEKNEAKGPMFKIKDDPRITRVGKFIRKTRIDELSQLFNVIKGDMSWIGPRPPLPTEVAKYEKHHLKRLAVKSGITGPWQVTGRHDLSFEDIVKLDTYYIENWSIALDAQIFFKTIWLMFTKLGQ